MTNPAENEPHPPPETRDERAELRAQRRARRIASLRALGLDAADAAARLDVDEAAEPARPDRVGITVGVPVPLDDIVALLRPHPLHVAVQPGSAPGLRLVLARHVPGTTVHVVPATSVEPGQAVWLDLPESTTSCPSCVADRARLARGVS